eukprot:3032739-Prymnesium_polylepis.1
MQASAWLLLRFLYLWHVAQGSSSFDDPLMIGGAESCGIRVVVTLTPPPDFLPHSGLGGNGRGRTGARRGGSDDGNDG